MYTDALRQEVEETFETIDENGDQRISYAEFVCLLLDMDREWQASALRRQFDTIDVDRDGFVSFDEFKDWVAPHRPGTYRPN